MASQDAIELCESYEKTTASRLEHYSLELDWGLHKTSGFLKKKKTNKQKKRKSAKTPKLLPMPLLCTLKKLSLTTL